jgi:FkbM family methyltransferase
VLSAVSTLARLIREDIRLVATEVAIARRPIQTRIKINEVVLTLGPWVTTSLLKMLREGSYEGPERDVVLATVRPDDFVVEVGAGAGYITTIVAGIASEVRSFEANPRMVAIAQSTVAANQRRATVTNGVISRWGAAGTTKFYLSHQFLGSSLIPSADADVIDVPVIALADALDQCTYLIADIEGAEIELLSGDLLGVERICVECHPQVVGLPALFEMVRALEAQGFVVSHEISQGQVLYLERPRRAAG